MRVTPPVIITPAKIVSSSAADIHNPAAYAGGTTYAYGDIVSVAADYAIYESLAAANTGNAPISSPLWWRRLGPTEAAYNIATTYPIGATVSGNQRCYESLAAANLGNPLPVPPETATDWWIDVQATNKYSAFDLDSNTQTVCPSPATFVFAPGERVNTLGISGMQANELTVTGHVGGSPVYGPKVFDLNTRIVNDGYDYAFEPFGTQDSKVMFDLPPYTEMVITITLSAASGNVKCGSIVVGTSIYLGQAEYQAKADSLNFSTVDRDLYGKATLVPRPMIPKTSQRLILPAARVNKVLAAKTQLNARPALWTGLDDAASNWFEMLQVIGIWKQFDVTADGFDRAVVNLEIEGI